MNRLLPTFSIPVAALILVASAFADPLPPDVLVKSRWMELTRADYERALARVPEKHRFEFAASPKRIQDLLNGLLVTKTLAAQARSHGTRPGPKFAPGDPEGDRELAAAELRRIDADAGRAFDARKSAFEAKARELYELDREKYRAPDEVRISDIAVSIKDRGEEAALARAREARQKLLGGAEFATIAREYSDDATTRDNGGALPFVSAKRLAPDYAKGVFALSKPGEISEPIKGPVAYHVVRLDERRPAHVRPFEEVRDEIMQGLRSRYIEDQRNLRIRAIHEDPDIQINQAAIDALVNRIDPKLLDPKAATTSSAATPRQKGMAK
jgi:peptidyl-prolyl cis-trans isomerase C